jgi:hypothetical protein
MVVGLHNRYIGINVLDMLPMLALETMNIYDLEQFAKDCNLRAVRQPDDDRGCWLTEIFIELADQAISLRDQRQREKAGYERLPI